MAGSGSDEELAHWQTLAKACQDEGADAFELNLSCPHMDRKDMGSNIGKDQEQISIVTQVVKEVAKVPVWAKLTPSTTDIVDRGARRVSRRRRRDRLVEHVPVAAADRSRDARVRDERGRSRLEWRTGRAGDPSVVAGEDGADDAGVARPSVLGHRRHRRVRACAQLFPARLRHRAGVHGRHARPRDRAQHHQGADPGHARSSSIVTPTRAGPRSKTSAGCGAIASSRIRRSGGRTAKEYHGGHEAEYA